MDLNQIQALIKFVSKSGVNEVGLETKDFKINIKTGSSQLDVHQQMMAPTNYIQPQAIAPAAPAPTPSSEAAPAPKANLESDKYVTIKSPNVGDEVSNGKVICIIEAMKLFNEIECEISGKIVKVLVDDASPVEYDQPLFLVDPS
jgi:acetyl-CoA carboxylase biotin carboxyl carrier protein